MSFPIPANETERLAALVATGILDTLPEALYDDITRLAATICGTPIAVVSLLDDRRQWFKSAFGIDAKQTPRDVAFCAHAILHDDVMEVPDATKDLRFSQNPLVTGSPDIRFYAGVPLKDPEGFNLGTLCVIDRTPRELTPPQREQLEILSRQVMSLIELHRRVLELEAVRQELTSEKDRFRLFMDHSPAVAYVKDSAGRFAYVNAPCCEQFHRPESDWIGKSDFDFFSPETAKALRGVDEAILAEGERRTVYESAPTPGGEDTLWKSFKFRLTDRNGQHFLAGMSLDVTAEKKAEDALRRSEAIFRSTVDRLAEGVFIIDPVRNCFADANAAVLAMLGYTAEEFFALKIPEIIAGENPDVIARNVQNIQESLAKTGRCDLGRKQLRRKDGSTLPVEVRVSLVPDGAAGLHAVVVRDVTEQAEYEERLFHYQLSLEDANARLKAMATTDALTGAGNRAAFNDRLAEEYDRSDRYRRSLSLLMMDVDHFKTFNDSFGHPAGDEVLRIVANLVRGTARVTDFVARYGGEEFAVIMPDTDLAGAMVMAERCRRAVAGASWDRRPVTVSIGVATATASTLTAARLLEEADQALYNCKHAGRNRVKHSSDSIRIAATIRA